nr:hypothetical protein [Cohnella rhizosphaerae]
MSIRIALPASAKGRARSTCRSQFTLWTMAASTSAGMAVSLSQTTAMPCFAANASAAPASCTVPPSNTATTSCPSCRRIGTHAFG